MRKLLLPAALLVSILAIAAAFVLLKGRTVHEVEAARLVPAEAIFFAELPNLPRSAARWPATALHALWQEPEMHAFLEQPREKISWLKQTDSVLEELETVRPRQAFFAAAALEGDHPRLIAGFSYSGSRGAVEHFLAGPRASFLEQHPAGKADLVAHGAAEIQTYTDKNQLVAECFHENWYFATNDLPLLKATLDRFDSAALAPKAGSLAASDVFRRSLAPLPPEPDLVAFLQPQAITERIRSLLAAAGQKSLVTNEANSTQAVAFATKMEGADFRDSWFAFAPVTAKAASPSTDPSALATASAPTAAAAPKLARQSLDLTTPETIVYYTAKLPEHFGATLQQSPVAAALASYTGGLFSPDTPLATALDHVGPELSWMLDWPAKGSPSLAAAAQLRDREKVRASLDAIPGWEHAEHDGAVFYQTPALPLPGFTPTFVLGDRFLLLTLGAEAGQAALGRQKAASHTLAQAPAFQAAADGIQPPTEAFAYLNTASLTERAYAALRPVLAMALAFNPDSAPSFDAGKLPSGKTLSAHLGATAYSQRALPDGVLGESRGPLTYLQTIAGTALIYGYTALPMIKQALQSGNYLPSLVPSTPSIPPAPSPPSAEPAPAEASPLAPAPVPDSASPR